MFKSILERQPNHVQSLNNLGSLYHEQTLKETVDSHFAAAVKDEADLEDPQSQTLNNMISTVGRTRAKLQYVRDKLQMAKQLYSRALAADPTHVKTL
eukprot:SAG31_NODE_1583_length_7828_cov_1.884332_8_plen_97_part_00